jgi:hypothetical protein
VELAARFALAEGQAPVRHDIDAAHPGVSENKLCKLALAVKPQDAHIVDHRAAPPSSAGLRILNQKFFDLLIVFNRFRLLSSLTRPPFFSLLFQNCAQIEPSGVGVGSYK